MFPTWNWEKTGVIPQAEWINGRKYWDEGRVEKHDRERMLAQTGKNQPVERS